MRPTSQLRQLYRQSLQHEQVSFGTIAVALGDNCFPLLLIILALLNIGLAPIPGQSIILGPPMLVIAGQWCLGRHTLWLPALIEHRGLKASHVRLGFRSAMRWLLRLEAVCKPRATHLITPPSLILAKAVQLLLVIAIVLPIPFANIPPAIAVIMIAIGELEEDGYMLWVGIIAGLLIAGAIIMLGMLAISGIRLD